MANLPRKMRPGSQLATQWNQLIDYLTSLRPASAPGTGMIQTSFGTLRSAAPKTVGGGMGEGKMVKVMLCDPDTGATRWFRIRGEEIEPPAE